MTIYLSRCKCVVAGKYVVTFLCSISGVHMLNHWQFLSEPFLYCALKLDRYRTTALAASITDGEMNTAHKVDTWTRAIIVQYARTTREQESTSDTKVKDALARILSSARNLAVFHSSSDLDLGAHAIPAIAACVHEINMQTWHEDINRLTMHSAQDILSHLGRFEQLWKLSLRIHLQWNGHDPTSLLLAPVNLPQLESLTLFIEELFVGGDPSLISPFSADVFTLLNGSYLPKLRVLCVGLSLAEYWKRAGIVLADVLSSFLARHRDLDLARLLGCDVLLPHILPGLGVTHLELTLNLDEGPPEMLCRILHPRVVTLYLQTMTHDRRAWWTGLKHLSDQVGAHSSLRTLDIMDHPSHHGASHHYPRFDGETVVWIDNSSSAVMAPAHLSTEQKEYTDNFMRMARSLAEKGVSLGIHRPL
jgi:hypothetical protein